MRSAAVAVSMSLLLLMSLPALAQDNDEAQIIVESINADEFPTVRVEVSVRDADRRPILGLTPDDFALREDGAPVDVTSVADSDLGLAVVLVVDTSDSMFAMPAAREAAQAFVEALGPNDAVALIDFDTNVVTLQSLTDDRQTVIDNITTLEQGGRTALYDGALRGVQEASGARQGRRMVVLLADGNESGESISARADALNLANENGIPVHTIGLGASADRTYLENIAALTGGEYLNAPDAASLRELYVGLAERLRHAYLITFDSGVPAMATPIP